MDQENPDTKKETVLINGKEHNVEDLTQEQVLMLNQLVYLENKIRQVTFNLDQLSASKARFSMLLNKSLGEVEEDEVGNENN